ncbi:MAG: SufD family Fe-S cluster assembly protein [Pseudomonadota bacterium]
MADTDAERALAELFASRAINFTDRPLDATRTDAFNRFIKAGLPHRRVEEYKYTDIRARLRTLPPASGEATPDDVTEALSKHPATVDDAARIVIANGRFFGTDGALPDGVSIASILSPEAPTESVGKLVSASTDPLTLANVGLFDGGAVIHVTKAVETPLEIVHLVTSDALVMGRLAVFVDAGASATIIERTVASEDTVTNALAEIFVEATARLSCVRRIEGTAGKGAAFSSHHLHLGANAQLEHLTITTGTGLARNQAFCHVAGDDAEANFRAATVALGARHADNTLVVRHDALNSRSSEVFRSAVGDTGVSVVQGRIIVDPGAQKTDAKMMSNALFLDETGEVVNKPELEIFADDVQCGHGATSGDLDDDPVFYLRARGIPEATARRLLVEAFLIEALERVEHEGLAEALTTTLRAAIGAEGDA